MRLQKSYPRLFLATAQLLNMAVKLPPECDEIVNYHPEDDGNDDEEIEIARESMILMKVPGQKSPLLML